jgi:two-component system sensor histidine kinase UhpB
MGPFLFTVRLEAEGIEALAEKSSPIGRRARSIGEAVTHIQNHVRLILKQLRPDTMIEVSLAQAIENLAIFWQRHHGGIVLVLDIASAKNGFGAEMDQAIFRLVQEGLTNAVRHGHASHVWVAITADDHAVQVRVDDDGTGLSQERQEGLGLKGMRERLAPLSGQFALRPRQGGGTRLTAEFPRARTEETA